MDFYCRRPLLILLECKIHSGEKFDYFILPICYICVGKVIDSTNQIFLFRVYLSRSLSRLFDPVNLMFASSKINKRSLANTGVDSTMSHVAGQPPTTEELDAVIRVIGSELSIACKVNDSSNRLWTAVAKNVAKTVR